MTLNNHIASYLSERYPDVKASPEQVMEYYDRDSIDVLSTAIGFIAYKLEGDAVIIYDIYIDPKHRTEGKQASKLFSLITTFAKTKGKRVVIGFSEAEGQNTEIGIKAMVKRGFKKYLETNKADCYIMAL